jgi:signal transduction histidine kinase
MNHADEKNTSPDRRLLLRRRKLTAASVVAACFLFLLMLNIGSYLFVEKMGRHLENALNARLKTAAMLSSRLIERDVTNLFDANDQALLRIVLSGIRMDNDLEAAYIIDENYRILLDSRLDFEGQVSRSYLREDSSAVQAASRLVAVSKLRTVAGNHFKNVYAPVSDLSDNQAILVLEANADFLDILKLFQRGLWIGGVISGALLLMIALFLIGATSLYLRTESQLQRSVRLASMGQMAATIAHEIRNPLGIIKGTSEVIKEKYKPPDDPDELFDFINEEVNRLNRLVNDFLALSRGFAVNRQEVELIGAIKSAIQKFRMENKDAVEISLEETTGVITFSLDKDLFFQLLFNLLQNAAQAAPPGSGIINISLEVRKFRGRKSVVIKVRDNGPGIAGDPNTIFEPFVTTKAQGTGLGLAVCRTIVQQHGGHIFAENLPAGGTEVTAVLPF